MFSSYLTQISPSENVFIDISPRLQLADSAIFDAKAGLLLPLNIFNSLFIFTLIAGAKGVEPLLPGPKPGVLPLDDAPIFLFYQLIKQDVR